MKPFKAFGKWYTYQIAPFSIAIRPVLRRALLITSLLLDLVAPIFIIHGIYPLESNLVGVAELAFAILFPLSAFLILLYLVTLQFNLDASFAKHWSKIIPHILFGIFLIGYIYITGVYGRGTPKWVHYIDSTTPVFIGWILSTGLTALYSKLLSYKQLSHCTSQTN